MFFPTSPSPPRGMIRMASGIRGSLGAKSPRHAGVLFRGRASRSCSLDAAGSEEAGAGGDASVSTRCPTLGLGASICQGQDVTNVCQLSADSDSRSRLRVPFLKGELALVPITKDMRAPSSHVAVIALGLAALLAAALKLLGGADWTP